MKNRTVKIVFIFFAFLSIATLFAAKLYENTVLVAERDEIVRQQMSSMEKMEFAPKPVTGEAKAFKLKDLEGKEYSLSDFKGKWVLLHFWATWCPSCVWEIPSLIKFSQDIKPENLTVAAVSMDTEIADVKKFWGHILPGKELPFLVLFDPEGDVAHSYGTFKLPETYLINPEGKLHAHFIGPREWGTRVASDYFKNLE